MQFIDRVSQGFRLVNLNKRFHLSHDSTDIFSAIDCCAVRAQGDNARLPSCDSTDIIARVFISDCS